MKYATRINSFLESGISIQEAFREIGSINGVDYVDMNYPEHFTGLSNNQIRNELAKNHLKLNAVNVRFRKEFFWDFCTRGCINTGRGGSSVY